jgi:hypothetical protein
MITIVTFLVCAVYGQHWSRTLFLLRIRTGSWKAACSFLSDPEARRTSLLEEAK